MSWPEMHTFLAARLSWKKFSYFNFLASADADKEVHVQAYKLILVHQVKLPHKGELLWAILKIRENAF